MKSPFLQRRWASPFGRLLILGVLVVPSACFAASTAPFTAWKKSGEEASARFCGSLGAFAASVDAAGQFMIAGRRGTRLPIAMSETVDWLWSMLTESDVLVAYESTDRMADSSSGGLCRFSGDLADRRWCTAFPAFNVVASMSSNKTVFLAGIGTVAEVDIRSGKYLWKVQGLYDRSHAFNIFLTPVERGAEVEFYATTGTGGAKPWLALVNRRTGKLSSAASITLPSSEAHEFARSIGPCSE